MTKQNQKSAIPIRDGAPVHGTGGRPGPYAPCHVQYGSGGSNKSVPIPNEDESMLHALEISASHLDNGCLRIRDAAVVGDAIGGDAQEVLVGVGRVPRGEAVLL